MILIRCVAALLLMSSAIPALADGPAPQGAPVVAEWPWRLTGTLLTSEQKIAVFASRNGKTQSIVEGKEIDGWTLITVRPESATLTAAGVARTITLDGFRRDAAISEVHPAPANAIAPSSLSRQAAVRNNLAEQENEHKIAFDALATATKQMELQKKQP